MNEFCKRVRALRIHMLIVGHLRKQMPALMGKKAAQERLLKNLAEEFGHVQREHHLPPGALTFSTLDPCMAAGPAAGVFTAKCRHLVRRCTMSPKTALLVMSCDIDGGPGSHGKQII